MIIYVCIVLCRILVSACDFSATLHDGDVSILTLLKSQAPTGKFHLCLVSSQSDYRFLWSPGDCEWIVSKITIKYPICRAAGDVDLWVTDLFTCALVHPNAQLQFEGLRLTGDRLIWAECSAEWCTHCLTPEYFYSSPKGLVTVIDRHPPPLPQDSFFTRSQCAGNEAISLFHISSGASLSFYHSIFSNIRTRAQSLVKLLYGKVTISSSEIVGMDFATAVLWQMEGYSGSIVEIEDSSIRGINRDHPYAFSGDSGFILAAELKELIIVNSTLEDNFLMPSTNKISYFLKVDSLLTLKVSKSVIHRCMGPISLSFSCANATCIAEFSDFVYESSFTNGVPHWHFTILSATNLTLSSVRFCNNHSSYSRAQFFLVMARAIAAVTVDNCTFHNNVAKNSGAAAFDFLYISNLVFRNTLFDEIGDYYEYNSPFNIFQYMIDEGLIDESEEMRALEIDVNATNPCEYMIRMQSIGDLLLESSSILASSGLCLNLLSQDSPLKSTIATFNNTLLSNPYGYGLNIIVREEPEVKIAYLYNSYFVDVGWGAIYYYTYTLSAGGVYLENCTFERVGDFAGNEAAIDMYGGGYLVLINCVFIQTKGSRAGAVFFLQLSQNSEDSHSNDGVLRILNCLFENNMSPQQGGDVYLFSPDGSAPIALEIAHTLFRYSWAKQSGGSLSLDNIRLKTAVISNCTFEAAASGQGGIVALQHVQGGFYILNSRFIDIDDEEIALIHIQTPTNTEEMEVFTVISGLTVQDCKFHSGLRIDSGAGLPRVLTRYNEFRGNEGTAIWNDYGNLTDMESVYANNTGVSSPCIFQNSKSIARFVDCRFEGNTASEQAGVMDIRGPKTEIMFEDCAFIENRSEKVDGIGHVEKSCIIHFHRSLFLRNFAHFVSILEVSNVNDFVGFFDSVIEDNIGDGLFSIQSSTVFFHNVSIHSNKPISSGAGFILQQSHLTISSSSISSVIGTDGCIINAYVASTVNITNSLIYDTECDREVFRLSSWSVLILAGTVLQRISTSLTSVILVTDGGALVFDTVTISQVSVMQVTNRDNQALVTAKLVSVSILNSVIENCNMALLQGFDLPLLIILSTAVRNIAAERNVAGAVICFDCEDVRVTNSKFEKIVGSLFGALRLETSDIVNITGCLFANITGGEHGAVSITADSVTISLSNWVDNAGLQQSYGGALHLNSLASVIRTCVFARNTANQGGAIYWEGCAPLVEDTAFYGNTAEYGSDLATVPTALRRVKRSTTETELVAASGQQFSEVVYIALMDPYDQIIRNDNQSEAWLEPASSSTHLSGSLKAVSSMGIFAFSEFVLTDTPGQCVNLTIISQTVAGHSLTLRFHLRNCISGEIFMNNACVICPPDSFSLESTETACHRCPQYAVCRGGADIFPQTGAWRAGVNSSLFFKCFREKSCYGHLNFSSSTGLCATGYVSNLCQSCDTGYSRSTRDTCRRCPDKTVSIVVISCSAVGFLLFNFITVRSSLRSSASKKVKLGLSMKVLMNYFQLLMLTLSFSLNWPNGLLSFLNSQDILGIVYEQLFGFGCFVQKNQLPPLFINLIIVVSLPLVLLIGSVIPWIVVSWSRRTTLPKDKCIGTVVVLLFVLHPAIMKTCSSMFNCYELAPGDTWLREEMSVECWHGSHTYFALVLALPSIITWGVGIPGLILAVLIRKRRQLDDLRLRHMFGFLFLGYRPERQCFWEFVILYRKVMMIACYVFLSSLTLTSQALITLSLLLVALFLQVWYRPYINTKMNTLEAKGILVASTVIYAGIYFVEEKASVGVQIFLFSVILALHMSFMVSWVWMMILMFCRYLIRKHSKCFHTFCGCILRCIPSLHERTSSESQLNEPTLNLERQRQCKQWLLTVYLSRLSHHMQAPPSSPEQCEVNTLWKI